MNFHNDTVNAGLSELAGFSIFDGKSKEQVLELCQGGQIMASTHRECLFNYGDQATFFGLVLSGAYKLSRQSLDGEDVIMHFAMPGELVAVFVLTQPDPRYPVTATSMGASRLLKVPKETYLNVWKGYPDMVFKVQEMLATRLCLLHNQKVLTKAPLTQKVASLLIALADKNSDENGYVRQPMTRKEIAESSGSSVESVIRIMSDWSKQGLIRTHCHQIQILKPEKLYELSLPSIKS